VQVDLAAGLRKVLLFRTTLSLYEVVRTTIGARRALPSRSGLPPPCPSPLPVFGFPLLSPLSPLSHLCPVLVPILPFASRSSKPRSTPSRTTQTGVRP
jgi:hypothetical protein